MGLFIVVFFTHDESSMSWEHEADDAEQAEDMAHTYFLDNGNGPLVGLNRQAWDPENPDAVAPEGMYIAKVEGPLERAGE